MFDNYPQFKKISQYIGIFIVCIVVLVVLLNYLKTYSFGGIIVKTDRKNQIIIIPENYLGEANQPVKAGNIINAGYLERIKAGTYVVTVTNGINTTSQETIISSRKATEITINLSNSNGVKNAVGNINSASFSVSANNLLYLDQVSNQINYVNKNDQLLPFQDQTVFKSLQWADPDYGIAQDNGGLFHVITQSGSRNLNLPSNLLYTKPYEESPQISLATNRQIYILNGTTLYTDKEGSSPSVIGSENRGVSLVGGPTKLAEIYRSADKSTSGSNPSTLSVIDLSGKSFSKNIYVSSANWSPSGKYIAVASNGFGKVFDDSLNLVAIIPTNSISNFKWLNDSTLYYSSGNMIWQFIINSKTTSTIYTAPSSQSIITLYLDQNSDYLYFSQEGTDFNAKNVSLYKIPLKNQTINQQIVTTQSLFPWLVGRCIFTLTNFNKPTVQYFDPLTEDNCPLKAHDFLQTNNIDPSVFNYSSTVVLPSLPGN